MGAQRTQPAGSDIAAGSLALRSMHPVATGPTAWRVAVAASAARRREALQTEFLVGKSDTSFQVTMRRKGNSRTSPS